MCNLTELYKSSIGKKQIVASTGLLLIFYIIAHLAGNLLIFKGPEAFNGYANKMAQLRPALYIVEFGLLWIFLIHMYTTTIIVLENIKARGQSYNSKVSEGDRSLATKLMPFTGTILLLFVVWHLIDFTFIDKHGPRSILPDGNSYGLYGVVYNSFSNALHSAFYIIAMFALGFHLSHGIQSFAQTFGLVQVKLRKNVNAASNLIALVVTLGYSSIPLFVLFDRLKY